MFESDLLPSGAEEARAERRARRRALKAAREREARRRAKRVAVQAAAFERHGLRFAPGGLAAWIRATGEAMAAQDARETSWTSAARREAGEALLALEGRYPSETAREAWTRRETVPALVRAGLVADAEASSAYMDRALRRAVRAERRGHGAESVERLPLPDGTSEPFRFISTGRPAWSLLLEGRMRASAWADGSILRSLLRWAVAEYRAKPGPSETGEAVTARRARGRFMAGWARGILDARRTSARRKDPKPLPVKARDLSGPTFYRPAEVNRTRPDTPYGVPAAGFAPPPAPDWRERLRDEAALAARKPDPLPDVLPPDATFEGMLARAGIA